VKENKIIVIAQELRRIADDNKGLLLPENVVAAARPVTSPLHPRFEWDNSKAAAAYRIWQARQLIRVVVEVVPGMNVATEVFCSLSRDRNDEGGYRVVTTVLSSEELREEMLADALAELETFRIKYRRLQELVEVFDAIKRMSKKSGKKKDLVPA
jgi:hypothetical protein